MIGKFSKSLLLVLCGICAAVVVVAQEAKPASDAKAKALAAPSAATVELKAGVILPRRELTWRQRRELGLTFENALATARQLSDAGELDPEASHAELAAQIAIELQTKNAKAFSEQGVGAGISWEAILALLEKWLPIILKLLAL